jgi:hypothetical protein
MQILVVLIRRLFHNKVKYFRRYGFSNDVLLLYRFFNFPKKPVRVLLSPVFPEVSPPTPDRFERRPEQFGEQIAKWLHGGISGNLR